MLSYGNILTSGEHLGPEHIMNIVLERDKRDIRINTNVFDIGARTSSLLHITLMDGRQSWLPMRNLIIHVTGLLGPAGKLLYYRF